MVVQDRFWPRGDIRDGTALHDKIALALFYHLDSAEQNRARDSDAEFLGGLDVDRQRKLARQHDRQIGRLGALEDLAGVDSCMVSPWQMKETRSSLPISLE